MTSLFTNVPFEYTIDIIRKVYEEKLIKTDIPKKEMKELLLLCTKNVHFEFNGETFQQLDGAAMGSPLGPVIAGIFMVELENTLKEMNVLSNSATNNAAEENAVEHKVVQSWSYKIRRRNLFFFLPTNSIQNPLKAAFL